MGYNFYYLVKPMYGGWVSFTAHLLNKDFSNKLPLFKIGKKTEQKTRKFAFNLRYQNIAKEAIHVLDNPVIIAFDKNHEQYLDLFNEPTLFIHALNEPKEKYIDFYKKCKQIIVIRESMQKKMKEKFDIDTTIQAIPFYEYPLNPQKKEKTKAISMARVEYRKRQDIICLANAKLDNPIDIYGDSNGIYVYHTLKPLGFSKYYKGKYAQDFTVHQDLLEDSKYLVNLTQVNGDGGQLEYASMQAIYQDTAVILHRDWINAKDSVWKEGINCYGVENESELADIISSNTDTSKVCSNAKKLLKPHIEAKWLD